MTTENNVVIPFTGTYQPEPEVEAPATLPPDWAEKFIESDWPHLCSLVEQIGWAENEEEMRLRMAEVKAAVSTWPI